MSKKLAFKNSISKGQWAEQSVKKFLCQRGFVCEYENLKTPWAQVDLVFSTAEKMILLEVKSLSRHFPMEDRVSRIQKNRLRRASLWLYEKQKNSESRKKPVEIFYAYVFEHQRKLKIQFIADEV